MNKNILTQGEIPIHNIGSCALHIQDLDKIFQQLDTIRNIPLSMDRINNIIQLCVLPFYSNGKEIDVRIEINPIQDFIDSDILKNIKKFSTLDRCNIIFLEKDTEDHKYKIHHKKRSEFISAIQQFPELEHKIVDVYYYVYSSLIPWLQENSKLFSIRKDTSLDIWTALKDFTQKEFGDDTSDGIFTPEEYGLVTLSQLDSYKVLGLNIDDIYDKYGEYLQKTIQYFHGEAAAEKVELFLKNQKENNIELQSSLFSPIKNGETRLQLDGKFLYLDNGHYLYQDIIDKSIYNEYFNKEIELIRTYGSTISSYIHGKYTGLGVGNGKKDFELLKYAKSETTNIFIDSSLPSLQEAELLCIGNKNKFTFNYTHVSNVSFSQNWISDLIQDGNIQVIGGTFGNPHPMPYTISSFQDEHNFFSMLGGTYGNFSGEYKIQFLQHMHTIMKPGDQLLLSVFKKPKSSDEIQNIIDHYNTQQTFDFVSNFFEKLGVSKANIEVEVKYENDTISIDAIIDPTKTEQKYITLSCYGDTCSIKNPIHIEILRSQRIDDEMIEYYLTSSKTSLHIQKVIQHDENPIVFYILSK